MSTKTSHRRRDLKAIGYAIAEEIECTAARYIGHGYSRKAAVNLAIHHLAGSN